MQRVNKYFFFLTNGWTFALIPKQRIFWRVGGGGGEELALNSVRSGQKLLVSFRGRRGWHRPRRLNSILDPTVKDIESSRVYDTTLFLTGTDQIFHLTLLQRLRSELPFGISTILFPIKSNRWVFLWSKSQKFNDLEIFLNASISKRGKILMIGQEKNICFVFVTEYNCSTNISFEIFIFDPRWNIRRRKKREKKNIRGKMSDFRREASIFAQYGAGWDRLCSRRNANEIGGVRGGD